MKKVLLFAVMLFASALVITSCGGGATTETDATADTTAAVEVEPTPAVVAVDNSSIGDIAKGEEIYNQVCMACHATGVAGAAKLDDKARWEASAAKGFETIKNNTIVGFTGEHGVMPAKGGRADLTDEDMLSAVAFMFQKAEVQLVK